MVYRSPVAVGGFEPVTDEPIAVTTYVDHTVTNGFAYYYTIASVSENGLYGELSASAMGVASVGVDEAFYVGQLPETLELAYGATVELQVGIRIEGLTEAEGAAPGVRVRAGMFSSDAREPFNLLLMEYMGEQDSADVYSITFAPPRASEYSFVAEYSADAGQTRTPITLEDSSLPTVTVEAGDDTTPPDAPATVAVERASVTGVSGS